MTLQRLDHVNVRTAKLEEMVRWYANVLDMHAGPRPPFPFPGAWLYVGGDPVVHLVGVAEDPANVAPKIEHFAFSARGFEQFRRRLEQSGEPHDVRRVPGGGPVQINVWDPDGNHIHIDFTPDDAAKA
jgi:catechol 2,3-dioxygenase-like lactoylglutathione lyase family enzyme